MINKSALITLTALAATSLFIPTSFANDLKKGEVQAIAEEAFIYAYPMIMAYGIMYEYNIDKSSGQYKGPFNQITNESQVYTPKDTAVVTPNSDTPYSFISMDLRAQPMVICVPKVEKNRYYSVQLVSQYTFNFAYIGSRATGNDAGCYAIAGPNFKGKKPNGISKVFQSGTEFATAIFRTQLFDPQDIDNVKKIQDQYKIQPLSAFLNQSAPKAPPEVKWIKIDKKQAASNPFEYLNFLLQFAPTVGAAEVEKPLRARFAKIGIQAGKPFSTDNLSKEQQEELNAGIKSGLLKIKLKIPTLGKKDNGWRVMTSGFGDRKVLNNDWLTRAAVAMAGIYGNDAVEALYPLNQSDNKGEKLDGSKHKYVLTFSKDKLPPVNAFWSVTMYDGKTQLLIENPINRYLINSPMLPHLKKNKDGSISIYIQKDNPGKEFESNWLPAPDGPIYLVMRLYWPKEEALSGKWRPPFVNQLK